MQTSSCAESAAVIRAAQPDYPALSESRGDSGTAYVRISLLSNGRLADATIDQSSGIAALDKAALQATHESEFMPERRNCAPVAGSYLFVVSFER
jgi:protein TonB